MNSQQKNVTRIHLKGYGLSEHNANTILKGIEGRPSDSGLKEYPVEAVQRSINERLSNPRIHQKTRDELEKALLLLNHEPKVVEIDFLRKLSPEQRLEFFYNRLEEISQEESKIRQETEAVLQKARQVVGARN
ncbi:MAG: hypothetical protein ACRC8Y_23510 [Chroococcales cyanobacterium]